MNTIRRSCVPFHWAARIVVVGQLMVLWSGSAMSGPNIVIVHSYDEAMPWVQEQHRGFKNSLPDHTFHTFYLNSKVLPPAEIKSKANTILAQSLALEPNLYYVTDDNAFNYVASMVPNRIPVVFSGVNGGITIDYPWAQSRLATYGILERPLIKRSLIQIKSIVFPEMAKVLVLMGLSTTDQAVFLNDLAGQERFVVWGGVEVDVFRESRYDLWQRVVSTAAEQGYNAILVAGNYALRDKKDKRVDPVAIARWLAQHTELPVFTVHEQQIAEGLLVGGMVVDGGMMGKEAAMMAKQVLTGKDVVVNRFKTLSTGRYVFSRAEVKRLQLTVDPKYIDRIDWVP
ncbi:ABC transporter substrate-binding protein [Oleiphilus messinensis]|nr:hypothetical protein [Oleiphilus messinensis]